MNCDDFSITLLDPLEFIGNSLPLINSNFVKLNDGACFIYSELQKRLKIEYKGKRLPADTFVLNFSGTGVTAQLSSMAPSSYKYVHIPITGVTHLMGTDLYSLSGGIEVAPYDLTDKSMEGRIKITGHIPVDRVNIYTFFYFGAYTAINDPHDGMNNGLSDIPDISTIEDWVNNSLKIASAPAIKNGDQVYVIYQKTGYRGRTSTQQSGNMNINPTHHESDGYNNIADGVGGVGRPTYQIRAITDTQVTDTVDTYEPTFVVYKLLYDNTTANVNPGFRCRQQPIVRVKRTAYNLDGAASAFNTPDVWAGF
jgi:hypothetical protein